MRQIVAMAIGALLLLAAGGAMVLWMGEDAEFTGNPLDSWTVDEKAGRIASDVKESVGSAAQQVQEQVGEDSLDVRLPAALHPLEFGSSLNQMAEAYTPDWRKQKGGKTVFAHYPRENERKYYVFKFGSDGLESVAIRMKPGEQQDLDGLYEKVMARTTSRFGGDVDTRRRRWKDKSLVASLRKRANYVALRFTPRP